MKNYESRNCDHLIKRLQLVPQYSYSAAKEILRIYPEEAGRLFLETEDATIRSGYFLAIITESATNKTVFKERIAAINRKSTKKRNYNAELLSILGAFIQYSKTREDNEGLFDWLSDAFDTIVDTVVNVSAWVVDTINSIVDAIVGLGEGLVSILSGLSKWTIEAIGDLITALFVAGLTLAELIGDIITYTYNLASKFVYALLDLGKSIYDILSKVAGKTYWALRRIVNGIVEALGPVGEILAWAYDQTQGIVEQVMKAIRYAGGVIEDAVEWAFNTGVDALEAVVRAWENMGETLKDLYTWVKDFALDAGEFVWFWLGQVTQKIKNSIYYVLNFLKNDLIPAIAKFVTGLVHAGLSIIKLITWIIGETIEITVNVLSAILDAGIALTDLLVTIIQNGDLSEALEAFVNEMGKTFSDLLDSIKDSGDEFIEQVVLTYHELKDAVIDEILTAVWDLAKGSFGFVVSLLLNTLSTYRELSSDEITEAKKIFGDSLEYEKIYISSEIWNPMNNIIFWIQDYCRKNPDSRAFVSGSLINFDPNDGQLSYLTLTHELTHVLQASHVGFKYMGNAIIGQDDAYNYGYTTSTNYEMWDKLSEGWITLNGGYLMGENGGSSLPDPTEAALFSLHPESLAQMIQHCYARLVLASDGFIRDSLGVLVTFSTTDNQSYQEIVDLTKSL